MIRQLVIVIILLSSSLLSQETKFRELMMGPCHNVKQKAVRDIQKFYEAKQQDSLNQIFSEWQSMCGDVKLILPLRILTSIGLRTFNEDIYDREIKYILYAYTRDSMPSRNCGIFADGVYMNEELRNLTASFATSLRGTKDLTPLEKFFIQVFSKQKSVTEEDLISEQFKNTHLQHYVLEARKNYIKRNNFVTELYTGAWLPQKRINVLGNHMIAGFGVTKRWSHLQLTWRTEIKMLQKHKPFLVQLEDSMYTANMFSGMSSELAGRLMIQQDFKQMVYLTAGAGYNIITVFSKINEETEKEDDYLKKNLGSLDISGGVGYQYHLDIDKSITVELRFHHLNYNNTGGTDLYGSAITLQFGLQFISLRNKYPHTYLIFD